MLQLNFQDFTQSEGFNICINSFMTEVPIIEKVQVPIMQNKSMDRFIYDRDLRHGRVNDAKMKPQTSINI